MRKYLASLIILLSGCGFDFATIPNQKEAVALIWDGLYADATQGNPSPALQWITQKDLNCAPNSDGIFQGFYRGRWYTDTQHSDVCVGGVTWEDWGVSQIALMDANLGLFSKTSFPHELWHMALHYRDGDGNPSHSDPGFGIAFGHPFGIVDEARVVLENAGL